MLSDNVTALEVFMIEFELLQVHSNTNGFVHDIQEKCVVRDFWVLYSRPGIKAFDI